MANSPVRRFGAGNLGHGHGLGHFTFNLPVPAAALISQVLAPSPMARNSASPAVRAFTA